MIKPRKLKNPSVPKADVEFLKNYDYLSKQVDDRIAKVDSQHKKGDKFLAKHSKKIDSLNQKLSRTHFKKKSQKMFAKMQNIRESDKRYLDNEAKMDDQLNVVVNKRNEFSGKAEAIRNRLHSVTESSSYDVSDAISDLKLIVYESDFSDDEKDTFLQAIDECESVEEMTETAEDILYIVEFQNPFKTVKKRKAEADELSKQLQIMKSRKETLKRRIDRLPKKSYEREKAISEYAKLTADIKDLLNYYYGENQMYKRGFLDATKYDMISRNHNMKSLKFK